MRDTLLSDLPRGDPDRSPEDLNPDSFKPQSAKFASPRIIRSTADLSYDNNPGAIFLGVVDGTVMEPGIARKRHVMGGYPVGIEDDRHMLTVAGSRAGKGRAAIVPNMLRYPGSVLATDPKGELATITARHRHSKLGQAVHVLDPFGVTRGNAVALRQSFNPILAMRPNSVADAALIADALVVVSDKDAHWDESARTFIEGVILHVQTAPIYKGARSLVTVQALIAGGAMQADGKKRTMAALDAAMRSNPAGDGVVRDAAADFFDRPEKEQGSVLSTARRHLKFLNYPEIRGVVQEHDFQLSDLKTKRTTIYLCLPASHIGTCSRWLRLFINLTLQSMEQTAATDMAVPVLMVLDEFASLGKMRQIEDAAGQIAGFGVKLWPILQDLGQLKALYSERWETFMGNAGVLQFFGNNDLTTLEWIAKRCGKTSIDATRTNSITALQNRDGARGISQSIDVCELLAVDEAARFFNRDDPKHRQLIIWASASRPLILQRVYYDKHQIFSGLYDDRPKTGAVQ